MEVAGASAPMAAAFSADPSVAMIPSGRVSQPHLIPTVCLTFRPGCAMLSLASSARGTQWGCSSLESQAAREHGQHSPVPRRDPVPPVTAVTCDRHPARSRRGQGQR